MLPARLERPLLAAGLTLVTAHLLDLALSGPDTLLIAVLAIVAVPIGALLAQPHVTRATRFALGVAVGLLFAGFAGASHVLHAVRLGPDVADITGVGAAVGGLLLIAGGIAALSAPGRRDRRHRVLHAALWLVAAYAVVTVMLLPLAMTLFVTHAPRNPVQALGIAHRDVRVPLAGGGRLAAWYVPPRNGTAVVLIHGSSGNRGRVADRARLLARHGYGVLALDLPGNGESDGHSNGLGDNAQPAVTAALDYLERRPEVDRSAGFGVSLGGEVLLEAAGRDPRLRAVVSDGAARPEDAGMPFLTRVLRGLVRGVSGTRPAPALADRMPQQPVLLIASGAPDEIPVNRRYAADEGAELWEVPDAGHIGGLRARPAEYERRVIGFLDSRV